MAPPAAPAGHRPIQSFFRGGHEPCSTSTALPEATAPAPAAPPAAASVPAGCVPAWDRPNDRPRVVAYARRRRGARAGDAASAGATFSSNCDAKRPRLSVDRNRAEEDADADRGEGLPGPSPSASSEMDEPKRWTNRSGRVPVPTKQTKQLFLDLGQKSFGHVTCATCGLLYAKGEREDERTHAAYHAAHVEAEGSAPSDAVSKNAARRLGGKFGIACPRRWGFESAAWHSPDGSEWVVVCDRRDHAKRRAVALKIAAHVERMLGMRAGWALENEKAKMFVRVAGDRAVGALIAEPVSGAFRTVPDARGDAIQHERENAERENANAHEHRHGDEDDERIAAADFRSITRRGDTRERATLGVRALWTHPARRRCGVASQLLDTARHGMTAGYVSGERECAFTQPTEAGKRFARKACGREDGTFLVYLPE